MTAEEVRDYVRRGKPPWPPPPMRGPCWHQRRLAYDMALADLRRAVERGAPDEEVLAAYDRLRAAGWGGDPSDHRPGWGEDCP